MNLPERRASELGSRHSCRGTYVTWSPQAFRSQSRERLWILVPSARPGEVALLQRGAAGHGEPPGARRGPPARGGAPGPPPLREQVRHRWRGAAAVVGPHASWGGEDLFNCRSRILTAWVDKFRSLLKNPERNLLWPQVLVVSRSSLIVAWICCGHECWLSPAHRGRRCSKECNGEHCFCSGDIGESDSSASHRLERGNQTT